MVCRLHRFLLGFHVFGARLIYATSAVQGPNSKENRKGSNTTASQPKKPILPTMRPSFQSPSFFVIAFLLICFFVHQSYAAVLAIDYGTEWTKAALVKPGIPLQIVLTKDTKRKEQSVVSFKKQERLYGADAFNMVFYL